jgi:hypothetical protein
MNKMDKITVKYHQHHECGGDDMMYFTLKDVRKCMVEYHDSMTKEELIEFSVWDNKGFPYITMDDILEDINEYLKTKKQ